MFMFASDLDRTLIYSQRMIDESAEKPGDIRIAETKDGEVITYLTERTVRLLKEVSNKMLFVPVTTRTMAQYARIFAITEALVPKYAVTSNGGNILIAGKADPDWHESVKKKIEANCLPVNDAFRAFDAVRSDKWVKTCSVADELFFYCVIHNSDAIPSEKLALYSEYIEENGWRTARHGRKLYFIPNCLSKKDAVAHIAEKEGIQKIISAGDSVLDLEMAEISERFISPRHGEVYRLHRDQTEKIVYTKNYGISAGEELIKTVIKYSD
jgi:hydroxymethylpyrimidine pyrophosphatase-like HAD family hydrolase